MKLKHTKNVQKQKMDKRETIKKQEKKKVLFLLFLMGILATSALILALPDNPEIDSVSNSTYSNPNSGFVNISGGVIAKINLTANFQNTRWKAFAGNITGKYTLSDASGSTIFDWTYSSTTGKIYSTRSSGSITWADVNCSTASNLTDENSKLAFGDSSDNLTNTFNNVTHSPFTAAGNQIYANTCPTLNTYRNNATQDADFEEMILSDKVNTLYTTILENDAVGYDGALYDFQMIVPDNASSAWSSSIAYYLYVELD